MGHGTVWWLSPQEGGSGAPSQEEQEVGAHQGGGVWSRSPEEACSRWRCVQKAWGLGRQAEQTSEGHVRDPHKMGSFETAGLTFLKQGVCS